MTEKKPRPEHRRPRSPRSFPRHFNHNSEMHDHPTYRRPPATYNSRSSYVDAPLPPPQSRRYLSPMSSRYGSRYDPYTRQSGPSHDAHYYDPNAYMLPPRHSAMPQHSHTYRNHSSHSHHSNHKVSTSTHYNRPTSSSSLRYNPYGPSSSSSTSSYRR